MGKLNIMHAWAPFSRAKEEGTIGGRRLGLCEEEHVAALFFFTVDVLWIDEA